MRKDQARDLDETRRVLYMALLVHRTEKYEIAATAVNALLHHQGIDAPAGEVIENVLAAISGEPAGSAWVKEQVGIITDQLGPSPRW
jgi:hypothetical protein